MSARVFEQSSSAEQLSAHILDGSNLAFRFQVKLRAKDTSFM